MESIKNFISECGEAPPATNQSEETESTKAEVLGGTLMITACHDFDNATSKTALGLDEPHAIRLPHSIRQCFSSSSSHHAFILSVNGHLYSVGRNDHGQLGKSPHFFCFMALDRRSWIHFLILILTTYH
jgi:hypothetical protein